MRQKTVRRSISYKPCVRWKRPNVEQSHHRGRFRLQRASTQGTRHGSQGLEREVSATINKT